MNILEGDEFSCHNARGTKRQRSRREERSYIVSQKNRIFILSHHLILSFYFVFLRFYVLRVFCFHLFYCFHQHYDGVGIISLSSSIQRNLSYSTSQVKTFVTEASKAGNKSLTFLYVKSYTGFSLETDKELSP